MEGQALRDVPLGRPPPSGPRGGWGRGAASALRSDGRATLFGLCFGSGFCGGQAQPSCTPRLLQALRARGQLCSALLCSALCHLPVLSFSPLSSPYLHPAVLSAHRRVCNDSSSPRVPGAPGACVVGPPQVEEACRLASSV